MMTEPQKAEPSQSLILQRIYVKESSFISPKTPEIFKKTWKPEVKMELNVNNQKLEETVYEVVLTFKITLSNENQASAIIEIKQAGIFTIAGFDEEAIKYVLGSYCPNTLFPFARERICDIVVQGGFPQLLLVPINFDAIYAQSKQQQKEQAEKKNKWVPDAEEPVTIN